MENDSLLCEELSLWGSLVALGDLISGLSCCFVFLAVCISAS